ncbi:DUF3618 domain-containing protein [Streptomyces sp. NPDC051555]|uniref:DUF3618 domain-containing protein n=1 Tax=Streptomyces sp. NPDC051555 TaxID=3365657 RepID=UPI00378AC7AB
MTAHPNGSDSHSAPTPSAEELRHRIEHTRDELGRTVEALAGKADIKAQTKEKAAAMKEQSMEKAALVTDQIRETAGQAVRLVQQKTPEPVLDTTGQVVTAAKANRTPLLALGAALVVVLLVRRGRGRK